MLRNCRQSFTESATVALHSAIASRLGPLTKHVARFIAPSDFTREWLIQNAGIHPDRVATVVPFVDAPATAVDPSRGEYIAFAGRFAEEKGIATLLEAARIAGLPVRCCRNQNHLVALSLPAGVEPVVTQTREELNEFYRSARFLVFPSEWFETFGLVGAEAMSHGVPVIAARIGALQNLIDDEETGLFFEPRNAADLAQKMLRLWNDPPLCRRLGHAARRKVLAHWTVEHYFQRLLQVYSQVTAQVLA